MCGIFVANLPVSELPKADSTKTALPAQIETANNNKAPEIINCDSDPQLENLELDMKTLSNRNKLMQLKVKSERLNEKVRASNANDLDAKENQKRFEELESNWEKLSEFMERQQLLKEKCDELNGRK